MSETYKVMCDIPPFCKWWSIQPINDAPSSPHRGTGVETSSRHQGVEHWVGFWDLSTFSCLSCVVFSKPSTFIEYHQGRSSAAGSASSQMRHGFFFWQTKVGKLFKHLTNQTTCAVPFLGGSDSLFSCLFCSIPATTLCTKLTIQVGRLWISLGDHFIRRAGYIYCAFHPKSSVEYLLEAPYKIFQTNITWSQVLFFVLRLFVHNWFWMDVKSGLRFKNGVILRFVLSKLLGRQAVRPHRFLKNRSNWAQPLFRLGQFEKARDIYEEAMSTVSTV